MAIKSSPTLDLMKGIFRLSKFRPVDPEQYLSIGKLVESNAASYPDRVAIKCDSYEWSWQEFNQQSNQYGHFFKDLGLKPGSKVTLLIENDPKMLAAFVGLLKLGCTVGLVNTSLSGNSLNQCFEIIDSPYIIFGSNSKMQSDGAIFANSSHQFYQINTDEQARINSADEEYITDLDKLVNTQSCSNLSETASIKLTDPAYYIFTSGTTGMPKAAIVTHFHWYRASKSFGDLLLGLSPTDRIYGCLPLFHTAAMFIGFGATVVVGSSLYLAKKFSVTSFWSEIESSKSTVFLYIGELCRYLLNQPVVEKEKNNTLTMCVGNGLKTEYWDEFQERFGIKKVAEYYGSTEGNMPFMNIFNKKKTIGMALGKYKVVRYCQESNVIYRNSKGFCEQVSSGETGLLMTQITAKSPFKGYTDKEATKSKIVNNVVEDGDQYVNTGDLIQPYNVGFSFFIPHFQFIDRVGDSFRWKGENVATSQVEAVISSVEGVLLCAVYGVKVPLTDGRAGMCALEIDTSLFSLADFIDTLNKHLPDYAQPLFIRLVKSLETTDTHKIKKNLLQKEGYLPEGVGSNELYIRKNSGYENLSIDIQKSIESGEIKY